MDKKYVDYKQFKKERVISISDIMEEILRKIWVVIIFAAIFAFILGGFKYAKDKESLAEIRQNETTSVLSNMSQDEIQQINTVLELKENLQVQQEYVDNSILMQINPYNEDKVFIQYRLLTAEENKADLMSAYEEFINGDALLTRLAQKEVGTDTKYIGELVDFVSSNENAGGDGVVIQQQNVPGVFAIEVINTDQEACEKLAQAVMEVLTEYQEVLAGNIGAHTLQLIDNSYIKVVDKELWDYRYARMDAIYTLQNRVTSLISGMSETQLAVLEESRDLEETETMSAINQGVNIDKRYVIVGALGGMIVAVLCIVFSYLVRGTVNTALEFEVMYELRVLGQIDVSNRSNIFIRIWKKLNKKKKRTMSLEEEKNLTIANLSVFCKKNGIKKFLMTGSQRLSQNKDLISEIVAGVRAEHIETEFVEELSYSANGIKTLLQYDDVVLIERLKADRHDEVIEEIRNCVEQNSQIMGVIVLAED